MLVYHYEKNNAEANYLELRFCVSGNVYCRQKHTECDSCKFNASKGCIEKVESVDLLSFSFKPNPSFIRVLGSFLSLVLVFWNKNQSELTTVHSRLYITPTSCFRCFLD